MSGSGWGRTLLPALIQPSQGPTPAAATRTSTSPAPGAGRGRRSTVMASGGPNAWTRAARIEGVPLLLLGMSGISGGRMTGRAQRPAGLGLRVSVYRMPGGSTQLSPAW